MDCIIDANIIIAFQRIRQLAVLRLYSARINTLHVPLPILNDELPKLNKRQRGYFNAIEPTINQLFEAANNHGQLSRYDYLCFLLAKEKSFGLMTNDGPLVKFARGEGIEVIRNPALLNDLLEAGAMPPDDAIEIVKKIHTDDPHQISETIYEKFKQQWTSP